MITAYAWLAAATAIGLTIAALPYAAHGLHALAPVLAAGLWAVALWAARRARARHYHRHGRRHGKTHLPRTRRALARARTLRLTTTARTA